MNFEDVTKANISQINKWFLVANNGNQFIEFYADSSKWLSLIDGSPGRKGYLAYLDNKCVGFVDVELNADIASIAFGVTPDFRGKGLGKMLIEEILKLLKTLNVRRVRAGVETANTISQALLISCGFKATGAPSDIIDFEMQI